MRCKRKSRPSPLPSPDVNPIMFFKAYLPERSSHQLNLPSALTKRFNSCLPMSAVLTCSSKRSWSINVEKDKNEIIFQNGWSEFVESSSLVAGDMLVFKYLGSAKFTVKIYDINGCEKNNIYALKTCKIEKDDELAIQEVPSEHLNVQEEEMITIAYEKEQNFRDSETYSEKQSSEDSETTSEKQSFEDSEISSEEESFEDSESYSEDEQKSRKKKKHTVGKRKRVRNKPPKHEIFNGAGIKNKVPDVPYKTKNPHFKIGVLPTYTRRASLNVPMPFAAKYFKIGRVRTTLQALDNSWPVTLTRYENGCCKISSGWLAFVRENSIKEWDICVFELIDLNLYAFKVTIFRI